MAGLRIGGLASGMDIDGIVSQLMTAERMPLDKIEKKKMYTEWQRDDYRTINTALSELDNMLSPLGKGVGTQAAFLKKSVTVSNEDAISVKNVNSVSNFTGTINKVTQLATAATMVGTGPAGAIDGEEVKLTTKMGNLLDFGTDIGPIKHTITIKAINKDGGFDRVSKKDENGKEILEDGNVVMEDKVFSYTISKDDTLQDVINKINADSGVNVFFDEKSKKFSIQAQNTGVPEGEAAIQLGGTIEGGTLGESDSFFNKVMKMGSLNSGNEVNEDGSAKGTGGIHLVKMLF